MSQIARRYRTIWISDIHLGTRGCKADFLIDFLRWHGWQTSVEQFVNPVVPVRDPPIYDFRAEREYYTGLA